MAKKKTTSTVKKKTSTQTYTPTSKSVSRAASPSVTTRYKPTNIKRVTNTTPKISTPSFNFPAPQTEPQRLTLQLPTSQGTTTQQASMSNPFNVMQDFNREVEVQPLTVDRVGSAAGVTISNPFQSARDRQAQEQQQNNIALQTALSSRPSAGQIYSPQNTQQIRNTFGDLSEQEFRQIALHRATQPNSGATWNRDAANYMTNDELDTYFWLSEQNPSLGQTFLSQINQDVQSRADTAIQQQLEQSNSPNLMLRAEMAADSITGNAMATIAYLPELAARGAEGLLFNNTNPTDPNSIGSRAMQDAAMSHQLALAGTSGLGRMVGEAALSGANSLTNFALLGPTGGAISMGVQAGAQGAYDAGQSGGNIFQQIAQGTLSGAAESVFERIGFGALDDIINSTTINSVQSFLKSVGSQMGKEGITEALTELSNLGTNLAVMGAKSDLSTVFNEFLARNPGQNAEAFVEAVKYAVTQVGYAGTVGALAGGGMGAAGAGVNVLQTQTGVNKYAAEQQQKKQESESIERFKQARSLEQKSQNILQAEQQVQAENTSIKARMQAQNFAMQAQQKFNQGVQEINEQVQSGSMPGTEGVTALKTIQGQLDLDMKTAQQYSEISAQNPELALQLMSGGIQNEVLPSNGGQWASSEGARGQSGSVYGTPRSLETGLNASGTSQAGQIQSGLESGFSQSIAYSPSQTQQKSTVLGEQTVVNPSAYSDAQKATADAYAAQGIKVEYTATPIEVSTQNGTQRAEGAYFDGEIIVDGTLSEAEQKAVADHEFYHAKATDESTAKAVSYIKELSNNQFENLVEVYSEAYSGVYDGDMSKVMEEMAADLYAGKAAFKGISAPKDIFSGLSENAVVPYIENKVKTDTRFSLSMDEKAINHFGKALSWENTGYLTPQGVKIDFSGKHYGSDGKGRQVDHRKIDEIYDNLSGTDAMIDFMALGNIRISPEASGIDLSTIPTKKQQKELSNYIRKENGEIILDISGEDGSSISSTEYPKGTTSSKILNDITNYFENNATPSVSAVQAFRNNDIRYSLDSNGQTLSKQQQEFFKDSKVRDADGHLEVMYHGNTLGYKNINVFKKGKRGYLGGGIYLTPDSIVAKSYADKEGIDDGKVYSFYANVKKPLVVTSNNPTKEILNVAYNTESVYNNRSKKQSNDVFIIQSKDIAKLKSLGYDGIFWNFGKNREISVFESSQIKNVDNKTPTDSPDIRYSLPTDSEVEVQNKNEQERLVEEDSPQVAEVLTESTKPKTKATERFVAGYKQAQRKLVDSGNEFYRMSKQTDDKFIYDVYDHARKSRQMAEYMLAEGQTNKQGEVIGKSLVDIFEPIIKKGEDYQKDFYTYLLHMHNVDRMTPIEERFSQQQIEEFGLTATEGEQKPVFGYSVTADLSSQESALLLSQNPEFPDLAKEVYDYNKNLMQFRIDTGLVSQEQANIMNELYPHYVPTFRDMSGTAGSRANAGNAQVAQTVKKATGSNRDLLPLHESMSRQTMQTVAAGTRNDIGNYLLTKSRDTDLSQFIETPQEVQGAFDVDQDFREQVEKPNTFTFYNHGKQIEMKVTPAMYEGLKAISSFDSDFNSIVNAAISVNNTFKKLITAWSPFFTIRNISRDLQDAGLYARNFKLFAKNMPKAVRLMKQQGKDWQQYKALGGYGASVFDYESGLGKNAFKNQRTGIKKVITGVEALGNSIEKVNYAVEQLPRFTEYLAILEGSNEKGNYSYETLLDAMEGAADITVNFGRSGTWGKNINKTLVPFFNPSMQGADKLMREIFKKRNPRAATLLVGRATILGILPSVLNELVYGDDEEYQKLHNRDKDTNYLIKIGDNLWIKIPKGRVLSVIGSFAQRTMRAASGQEDAYAGFIDNISNITPINPLDSNIFSTITALVNNRTWYGSPIVPQRLESVPEGEQYDENTTYFSKALGKALGYSPKKIDYMLGAYTGIIGDVLMPLMTPAAERNIVAANFTIDGALSSQIGTNFYDTKEENYLRSNSEDITPEDQIVYDGINRFLNSEASRVADLNTLIRDVENSDLSDSEKLDQIREHSLTIQGIQQNALDVLPEFEEALREAGTGNVDIDYLIANKELFGAEYAVQAYNSGTYEDVLEEGGDFEAEYQAILSRRMESWQTEKSEALAEDMRDAGMLLPEEPAQAPQTIIPEASTMEIPEYRPETLQRIEDLGISVNDWAYVDERLPGYEGKVQQLQEWGFEGEQLRGMVEGHVLSDTAQGKLIRAQENDIPRETYLDGYIFGYTTTGTKAERNEEIREYVNNLPDLSESQKELLYELIEVYSGSGESSGGSSSGSSSGSGGGSSRSRSSSRSSSSKSKTPGLTQEDLSSLEVDLGNIPALEDIPDLPAFQSLRAAAKQAQALRQLNLGESLAPRASSANVPGLSQGNQQNNLIYNLMLEQARKMYR